MKEEGLLEKIGSKSKNLALAGLLTISSLLPTTEANADHRYNMRTVPGVKRVFSCEGYDDINGNGKADSAREFPGYDSETFPVGARLFLGLNIDQVKNRGHKYALDIFKKRGNAWFRVDEEVNTIEAVKMPWMYIDTRSFVKNHGPGEFRVYGTMIIDNRFGDDTNIDLGYDDFKIE